MPFDDGTPTETGSLCEFARNGDQQGLLDKIVGVKHKREDLSRALVLGIGSGSLGCVQSLIAHSANVNFVFNEDTPSEHTPLQVAVQHSQHECVQVGRRFDWRPEHSAHVP